MNHKKGTDRSRMSESIVYMAIWLVLFIFPGILELIASAKGSVRMEGYHRLVDCTASFCHLVSGQ